MMMKIWILIPLLLLLSPGCWGWSGLRTAKYIHYRGKFTWSQAQSFCRHQHTDLVTIRNEIENLDFLPGQGWLGLYRADSTSKWKWSRGDEIANFTTWKGNEPDLDENCAYKRKFDHAWHSHPCSYTHTVMCYDERLVLVKEQKTWEEALVHCRALEAVDPNQPADSYRNHRYDLATLLTPDDYNFAREKVQEATIDEVWTGLRYLAGQWLWISGEEVQYMDIHGCPSQRFCGALVKNGTSFLKIRNCKQRKYFFCYKKP
eukprot:superscaffoldBa00000701_g6660